MINKGNLNKKMRVLRQEDITEEEWRRSVASQYGYAGEDHGGVQRR